MKPLLYCTTGLLFFCLIFSGISCQKDTSCKVVITCSDSAGKAVSGALVRLYALVTNSTGKQDTADVRTNGNTDGSGQVKFTFKQPATYDLDARVVLSSVTYSAISIVKLEEGTTVQKTITLRRYN